VATEGRQRKKRGAISATTQADPEGTRSGDRNQGTPTRITCVMKLRSWSNNCGWSAGAVSGHRGLHRRGLVGLPAARLRRPPSRAGSATPGGSTV